MRETCTKQDLMAKGYCEYQARTIMQQAKIRLVEKGCSFYLGSRIARVPRWVVEEILGFDLDSGKEAMK